MKRIHKLSGVNRSLLRKLNTAKGFFRWGNRVRFSVSTNLEIASLLFCLEGKPGQIIDQILIDSIGPLAGILQWNGENEFWFEPEQLLLALGSLHQFYDKQEANNQGYKAIPLDGFPFSIVQEAHINLPEDCVIPITIEPEYIIIGQGESSCLLSHTSINTAISKLLKKNPTKYPINVAL